MNTSSVVNISPVVPTLPEAINPSMSQSKEEKIYFDKVVDERDLCCPIGFGIMEVPVMLACGHNFEEQAIKEWFEKNGSRVCPLCKKTSPSYWANLFLRNVINNSREKVKQPGEIKDAQQPVVQPQQSTRQAQNQPLPASNFLNQQQLFQLQQLVYQENQQKVRQRQYALQLLQAIPAQRQLLPVNSMCYQSIVLHQQPINQAQGQPLPANNINNASGQQKRKAEAITIIPPQDNLNNQILPNTNVHVYVGFTQTHNKEERAVKRVKIIDLTSEAKNVFKLAKNGEYKFFKDALDIVNVEAINEYGRLLHVVVKNERPIRFISLVINKGIPIDQTDCDDNGNTALHVAVNIGSKRHIKQLLQLNANPNILNFAGQTPFTMALPRTQQLISEIIKKKQSERQSERQSDRQSERQSDKLAECARILGIEEDLETAKGF